MCVCVYINVYILYIYYILHTYIYISINPSSHEFSLLQKYTENCEKLV